jgi:glycerate-2-kinase
MLFKNQPQIINNGHTNELKKTRKDILEILSSSYDAVNPYKVVKNHIIWGKIVFDNKTIDISNFKNIYLIGFGKACIGMAQAVSDCFNIRNGAVITNDPINKVENSNIITYLGSHPLPTQNNVKNTDKILDIVKKCKKNDLLFVLISGGGSSLLCKPRVNIDDMNLTTDLLLKCGANINEINAIRKHLSYIKGGQLVNFTKGTIISLIISDIIGDPIEFIASGPTYLDSTTYNDAQKVLYKYKIWDKLPLSTKKVIKDGIAGKIPETPNNKQIFKNTYNFIVANNKLACNAAKKKAEELEYKTILLTNSLEGEAKEMGIYLAEKAINYLKNVKSIVFISGGETTVTIKGNGKGGRNQEMVLSSVEKLGGKDVVFSSFATDGIDGNSNAAGAIADEYTLKRAECKNMEPKKYLDNNNSYEFFKDLNDLLITNHTGTNVMDIQILVKK